MPEGDWTADSGNETKVDDAGIEREREREKQLEARLQGVEMAGQAIGPTVQALATSQAELANAMKRDAKRTMTLIDSRGVGKPDKYTGKDSESFLLWKIKLESFIYSLFPELEKVFAWAEDQESTVTMDRARAAFGTGTAEPVDDLEENHLKCTECCRIYLRENLLW